MPETLYDSPLVPGVFTRSDENRAVGDSLQFGKVSIGEGNGVICAVYCKMPHSLEVERDQHLPAVQISILQSKPYSPLGGECAHSAHPSRLSTGYVRVQYVEPLRPGGRVGCLLEKIELSIFRYFTHP